MLPADFVKPEALAEYPVVMRITVLWGDQDAFGHVNNTLPIRWFESARVAYLDQASLAHYMSAAGLGPILASISCQYRRQINYPDTLLVAARITRLGNSSLGMQHVIYSETQEAVCCEGDSVVVVFNYQEQKSVRVPDEVRAAIHRLEGKNLG